MLALVENCGRDELPALYGTFSEAAGAVLARLHAAPELISVSEAANLVPVPSETLLRWMRKGSHAWARWYSNKVCMVERSGFIRWLDSGNGRKLRSRDAKRRAGRAETSPTVTAARRERASRLADN